LLAAVEAADLLVLAFPLYVDSLPAPVIEILELIAEHRKDRATRRQSFSAIANCGFPEAGNNATALAICELFARQAGFEWAGSLAMGGGQLIDGVSLEEGGGKTLHIRKGLELAAGALAQGHAIPGAAQDLLRKPVVPPWVYKLMGRWRWRERAKKYGAIKGMKERPYAVKDPGRGS